VIANLSAASLLVVTLTLLPVVPVASNALGASAPQADKPQKAGAQSFEFTDLGPGLVALNYQGHRLLVYASASNQFKPYVKELYTLAGDNVLLDAPPDHLHHHGLMYATAVNGINFWEERGQVGYQKPVGPPHTSIGVSSSGRPRASLTQVIHWVGPKDATMQDTHSVALLVETRSLTVTVDEKAREVALAWHAQFQVGPGAKTVTLSGPAYNGLGLRLPPAFNLVARHENSEAADYPTHGKGDVTAARWSCVSHELNGHPITVALFGQPSTLHGLPVFFTMVEPFTYLAVTQALDTKPLAYAAGEPFTVDYLLVVYADRKSSAFLTQRSRSWNP